MEVDKIMQDRVQKFSHTGDLLIDIKTWLFSISAKIFSKFVPPPIQKLK